MYIYNIFLSAILSMLCVCIYVCVYIRVCVCVCVSVYVCVFRFHVFLLFLIPSLCQRSLLLFLLLFLTFRPLQEHHHLMFSFTRSIPRERQAFHFH